MTRISQKDSQVLVLGIDLGTTYTMACVDRGPDGLFIEPDLAYTDAKTLAYKDQKMPSAFCYHKSEGVLVGERAIEKLTLAGHRGDVIRNVKRAMKFRDKKLYQSGGNGYSPVEISSWYIEKMVRAAEKKLRLRENEITEAVVTVPAYFGYIQREATRDAARKAGLTNVHLLDEAVAAAIGLGLHTALRPKQDRNSWSRMAAAIGLGPHKAPANKVVLVADLGGGTFDITLLWVGPNREGVGFHELGRSGDAELGGLDWDKAMAEYVARKVKGDLPMNGFASTENVRLFTACEKAKHDLCDGVNHPEIVVEFLDDETGETHSVPVRRDWFLGKTDPLAQDCATICTNLLRDIDPRESLHRLDPKRWRGSTKLTWKDVDDVYLVGGGSKVQAVRDKIQSLWGRVPTVPHRPKHVVALGAAIYGQQISQGGNIEFLPGNVRVPHTIGVWHTDADNQQKFHELIRRNTSVPRNGKIRSEAKFTVSSDSRSFAVTVVEQRVDRFHPEGQYLDIETVTVPDLPERPSGQEDLVTFTLICPDDQEFQFHVEIRGKQQVITINQGLDRRESGHAT